MRRIVIVGLILFMGTPALGADDRAEIFQIVADKCNHNPQRRLLTGFVLEGYNGILTALYGVWKCDSIIARRFTDGRVLSIWPLLP
jgi:hypothetical protein